jgi:hypothetical protein
VIGASTGQEKRAHRSKERPVTNLELAKFRGEFLGLKILVMNCIQGMVERETDPDAFLSNLKEQALRAIGLADSLDVRRQHLVDFREAAERMIVEATGPMGIRPAWPEPDRGR